MDLCAFVTERVNALTDGAHPSLPGPNGAPGPVGPAPEEWLPDASVAVAPPVATDPVEVTTGEDDTLLDEDDTLLVGALVAA